MCASPKKFGKPDRFPCERVVSGNDTKTDPCVYNVTCVNCNELWSQGSVCTLSVVYIDYGVLTTNCVLTHFQKNKQTVGWFNPRNIISAAVWVPTSFCDYSLTSDYLNWLGPAKSVQIIKGLKLDWTSVKVLIWYMFVPKGGGTLAVFMYYWMNSGNIHVVWVNLWAAFM